MAGRLGMGLQELEGELRPRPVRSRSRFGWWSPPATNGIWRSSSSLQLERRTWSGGVVAVRWTALKLGRSEQAQGCWFGDDPNRKPHGHSTTWSIDSAAAWRPRRCCESRSFPTHSPSTRSGSFRGRTLEPTQRRTVSRYPRNSLGPAVPTPRIASADRCGLDCSRWSAAPHGVETTKTVRVVRSWGPERIATGWWRAQDVERDYYRAEWEDGTQVWVYRDQRNGRWFFHGFFD